MVSKSLPVNRAACNGPPPGAGCIAEDAAALRTWPGVAVCQNSSSQSTPQRCDGKEAERNKSWMSRAAPPRATSSGRMTSKGATPRSSAARGSAPAPRSAATAPVWCKLTAECSTVHPCSSATFGNAPASSSALTTSSSSRTAALRMNSPPCPSLRELGGAPARSSSATATGFTASTARHSIVLRHCRACGLSSRAEVTSCASASCQKPSRHSSPHLAYGSNLRPKAGCPVKATNNTAANTCNLKHRSVPGTVIRRASVPVCSPFPNRAFGIHWSEPHGPPMRMHDDMFAP